VAAWRAFQAGEDELDTVVFRLQRVGAELRPYVWAGRAGARLDADGVGIEQRDGFHLLGLDPDGAPRMAFGSFWGSDLGLGDPVTAEVALPPPGASAERRQVPANQLGLAALALGLLAVLRRP
jgi:hypothetical protein